MTLNWLAKTASKVVWNAITNLSVSHAKETTTKTKTTSALQHAIPKSTFLLKTENVFLASLLVTTAPQRPLASAVSTASPRQAIIVTKTAGVTNLGMRPNTINASTAPKIVKNAIL